MFDQHVMYITQPCTHASHSKPTGLFGRFGQPTSHTLAHAYWCVTYTLYYQAAHAHGTQHACWSMWPLRLSRIIYRRPCALVCYLYSSYHLSHTHHTAAANRTPFIYLLSATTLGLCTAGRATRSYSDLRDLPLGKLDQPSPLQRSESTPPQSEPLLHPEDSSLAGQGSIPAAPRWEVQAAEVRIGESCSAACERLTGTQVSHNQKVKGSGVLADGRTRAVRGEWSGWQLLIAVLLDRIAEPCFAACFRRSVTPWASASSTTASLLSVT